MKKLTDRGYSFTVSAEREIARDIIEKLCYIGVDYATELKSTGKEKTCELPVSPLLAHFRCAKVLFQQSFAGKGASGILDKFSRCSVTLTCARIVHLCCVVRWHDHVFTDW